jgi:RNA recognition motif-containing protein
MSLESLDLAFVLERPISRRNSTAMEKFAKLLLSTIKGYLVCIFFASGFLFSFGVPRAQSDRSRGFGFISMETVEDATRCIKELNGVVSPSFSILIPRRIFKLYHTGTQWTSHSRGLLCDRPPSRPYSRRIHGRQALSSGRPLRSQKLQISI